MKSIQTHRESICFKIDDFIDDVEKRTNRIISDIHKLNDKDISKLTTKIRNLNKKNKMLIEINKKLKRNIKILSKR